MQQLLETGTAADSFNMTPLAEEATTHFQNDSDTRDSIAAIKRVLSNGEFKQFVHSIVRNVFLIEASRDKQNDGTDATKMCVRWHDRLDDDPRQCPYDECYVIARDVLSQIADSWLGNAERLELLRLYLQYRWLPYEFPLDYATRDFANIHRHGNLVLMDDPVVLSTLRFREYVRKAEDVTDLEVVQTAMQKKIKTKTYLTDRAQTGDYKTNREKRWEAHPRSVQFSTRTECLRIEHLLVEQLCGFGGFPEGIIRVFRERGIITGDVELMRCPITLIPMSYADFRNSILNPEWGESAFQVGHLAPLKSEDDDAEESAFGHAASNISWISADGNRIQGELSMEVTRELLRTIARNYEDLGEV